MLFKATWSAAPGSCMPCCTQARARTGRAAPQPVRHWAQSARSAPHGGNRWCSRSSASAPCRPRIAGCRQATAAPAPAAPSAPALQHFGRVIEQHARTRQVRTFMKSSLDQSWPLHSMRHLDGRPSRPARPICGTTWVRDAAPLPKHPSSSAACKQAVARTPAGSRPPVLQARRSE